MSFRYFFTGLVVLVCGQAGAAEVALVMSVQGKVTRLAEAVPVQVEAFVKLREGDKLSLEKDSRLQVLYFDNGRHEAWSGPGRLEMTPREGRAIGLPAPEVKSVPMVMARQLAHTPALDGQGRGGVTRLRSVPSQDAISRLEDTYADLRSRAGPNDLGPEMYLLSGLFEMRELDRVERVVGDLQQDRPQNPEAALLVALYRKAVKNARENRKQ
jgi:hypothetical protein